MQPHQKNAKEDLTMNMHRSRLNTDQPPVARIVECDGEVFGEVTGALPKIERISILTHDLEEKLGCRFETIYLDGSDSGNHVLRIKVVLQRHHRIKAPPGQPPIDPRKAVLRSIFSDDRPAFPGSMIYFKSPNQ